MKVEQTHITLTKKRKGIHLITTEILDQVKFNQINTGLCHEYS